MWSVYCQMCGSFDEKIYINVYNKIKIAIYLKLQKKLNVN